MSILIELVKMHFSQIVKLLVFPVGLLICNLGSAVAYALAGDWKRAVYWAASAVCIAAVTF